MNNTIDKYIKIEFNYNNLGELEQKTKDNISFLEKLESYDDITFEEYDTAWKAIHKYYIAELERQLKIAKRKAGICREK